MIKSMLMKNKFICLFLVILSMAASCEKAPSMITEESSDYTGKMSVEYEGENFDQNGINVTAEFNSDSTMLDILLNKVKFVPAMPVRIDVTIMGIPLTANSDGTFTFVTDDIVPWAMGGPYDTYRVDDLSGYISDDSLTFEMVFYNTKKDEGYPTVYSGKIVR